MDAVRSQLLGQAEQHLGEMQQLREQKNAQVVALEHALEVAKQEQARAGRKASAAMTRSARLEREQRSLEEALTAAREELAQARERSVEADSLRSSLLESKRQLESAGAERQALDTATTELRSARQALSTLQVQHQALLEELRVERQREQERELASARELEGTNARAKELLSQRSGGHQRVEEALWSALTLALGDAAPLALRLKAPAGGKKLADLAAAGAALQALLLECGLFAAAEVHATQEGLIVAARSHVAPSRGMVGWFPAMIAEFLEQNLGRSCRVSRVIERELELSVEAVLEQDVGHSWRAVASSEAASG